MPDDMHLVITTLKYEAKTLFETTRLEFLFLAFNLRNKPDNWDFH